MTLSFHPSNHPESRMFTEDPPGAVSHACSFGKACVVLMMAAPKQRVVQTQKMQGGRADACLAVFEIRCPGHAC